MIPRQDRPPTIAPTIALALKDSLDVEVDINVEGVSADCVGGANTLDSSTSLAVKLSQENIGEKL